MQNRHGDEVIGDVKHAAMGVLCGHFIDNFCFRLSHSPAKSKLSPMAKDGLVMNGVEQGKRSYHSTPSDVEYFAKLNRMCERLNMESGALKI